MAVPHRDNRLLALICILSAIGFATTQDAILKAMSGEYSVYQAVILRCFGAFPILFGLLWHRGALDELFPVLLPRVILRASVLCTAHLAFVLSLAALPLATAVAIYFTMPFFVAGLAGPLLGETVRLHRWLAIAAGFTGVLVMVRPGAEAFEPAALLSLYSAMGYAYGQMIGRPLAQKVSPVVIALWQNAIYFAVALCLAAIFNSFDFSWVNHKSLIFLSRPWNAMPLSDALVMLFIGVLASVAMLLFITAYKFGESNFVAPFEYSSMIWAVAYGVLFFGDCPDIYTWIGAAIVVAAGILMILRDRQLDRAVT